MLNWKNSPNYLLSMICVNNWNLLTILIIVFVNYFSSHSCLHLLCVNCRKDRCMFNVYDLEVCSETQNVDSRWLRCSVGYTVILVLLVSPVCPVSCYNFT